MLEVSPVVQLKGKFRIKLIVMVLLFLLVSGCSQENKTQTIDDNYRNYYEIFVYSFNDSNGDGIGDLRGVIEKVPYLVDLGVTGIWLMPINTSPTYHKYDVLDYYEIDPEYGTIDDLKELIKVLDENNIKIIIDLVINHTARDHPWFKEAISAIKSNDNNNKYINYYNFRKTSALNYHYAFEIDMYYEGFFWSGMPDLNFDSQDVKNEILKIVDFYIDLGIDGFRLDAAMHIYHNNQTKNFEFWNWFSDYVYSKNNQAYLVGEVWSSESVIVDYYKTNLDSLFNFPFSQSEGLIAKSVIFKTNNQIAERYSKFDKNIREINPKAISANFISNHDNNRAAGFLMRDSDKIKMAASIYLMLPGNPFVYYGEEIGMVGSGNDPTKRLPIIWDSSVSQTIKNPPQAVAVEQKFPGVTQQQKDQDSILNHYKKALNIRIKYPEIARGTITSIYSENKDLILYQIEFANDIIVVAHNLSDEPIKIELKNELLVGKRIVEYLNIRAKINQSILEIPRLSSVLLK
jgi:glycosidase